ncbi:aa3-type cytochrome c oxidase subunit IV [Methylobacterium sp. BTF04]|nr:aa3-type cytochrome c oxidase subunit IV [Methylobacterium sp. BTF04]
MIDYLPVHSSMNVSAHRRDYHDFMIVLRYITLSTVVSLSFLTLMFCTAAGWGTASFVALLELGMGLYFARERAGGSWQADVASLLITTDVESGDEIESDAEVAAPCPARSDGSATDRLGVDSRTRAQS